MYHRRGCQGCYPQRRQRFPGNTYSMDFSRIGGRQSRRVGGRVVPHFCWRARLLLPRRRAAHSAWFLALWRPNTEAAETRTTVGFHLLKRLAGRRSPCALAHVVPLDLAGSSRFGREGAEMTVTLALYRHPGAGAAYPITPGLYAMFALVISNAGRASTRLTAASDARVLFPALARCALRYLRSCVACVLTPLHSSCLFFAAFAAPHSMRRGTLVFATFVAVDAVLCRLGGAGAILVLRAGATARARLFLCSLLSFSRSRPRAL